MATHDVVSEQQAARRGDQGHDHHIPAQGRGAVKAFVPSSARASIFSPFSWVFTEVPADKAAESRQAVCCQAPLGTPAVTGTACQLRLPERHKFLPDSKQTRPGRLKHRQESCGWISPHQVRRPS